MEQRGPGIAKARQRASSFSTLLDQVLDDESALDALVFAYEELALEDRRALWSWRFARTPHGPSGR